MPYFKQKSEIFTRDEAIRLTATKRVTADGHTLYWQACCLLSRWLRTLVMHPHAEVCVRGLIEKIGKHDIALPLNSGELDRLLNFQNRLLKIDLWKS